MKHFKITLLFILFIFSTPYVNAHTPLMPEGENNSIESAIEILNPTKSWTLYRELHEAEEVEYYKLHLKTGDKLKFSIFTPRIADPNFLPSAVVMWPGSDMNEDLPDFIEIPTGYGTKLVKGMRIAYPEYEPVTPTSYYFVANYVENILKEGDYYFAVFEPTSGGKYGLAIGYIEVFTAFEWLKIPFDLVGIHIWEGQSLFTILAPLLLTLIIGFTLLKWRKQPMRLVTSVGLMAGLLYVGSGLITLFQMVIALNGATMIESYPLTLLFVLVPILLGILLTRKVVRYNRGWSTQDRASILIIGVLGLFFWAGLIIGPMIAMIIALSPPWEHVRQIISSH